MSDTDGKGWVKIDLPDTAPDLILEDVKDTSNEANPDGTRAIAHPSSPFSWDALVVDAVEPPPSDWDNIVKWANQRYLEDQILKDLEAMVREYGKAKGLIVLDQPDRIMVIESDWIQPGTIIYSFNDQPDLMVIINPDDGRVLYYRQRVVERD